MKKFIAKCFKKANEKKALGKSAGFDGMVVAICLILLVMILIFLFNTVIVARTRDAINNVGNEVQQISDWTASQTTNGTNAPGNTTTNP